MYIYKRPVIKIKEKIVEVQVEKPVYIDKQTGEKIESYWYISYDFGEGTGFYAYRCNGDKFNYKEVYPILKASLEKYYSKKIGWLNISSVYEIDEASFDYEIENEKKFEQEKK